MRLLAVFTVFLGTLAATQAAPVFSRLRQAWNAPDLPDLPICPEFPRTLQFFQEQALTSPSTKAKVELWKHNGFVCEYHVLNEDGNFIGTIKTSRHPAKYSLRGDSDNSLYTRDDTGFRTWSSRRSVWSVLTRSRAVPWASFGSP